MKKISCLFLLFFIASASFGQNISGSWYGLLQVGGTKLHLVFNVRDSANRLFSTMDSPDQRVSGIGVTSTRFKDSTVQFEIANAGIAYEGKLGSSGIIAGTFKQGGMEIPLSLSKEKMEIVKPARPQEPTKPYPYYEEDVQFTNTRAGISLAGTLTLPKKEGKFPVVILITGSGPQNRDEEIMGHKPFLVIADHLTRKGIAVLRVDDRGCFGSQGVFKTATSWDFSTDVEAALDYLLTRKEINSKQIGLIGHSEGGLIAPMVASRRKEISYIVLLAGPGIKGEEILLKQEALISRANGKSEEAIRKMTVISKAELDMTAASRNTDTLKKELTDYLNHQLQMDTSLAREAGSHPDQFVAAQVKELTSPWMQYFIRYDPAPTLQKVKCPVLALDGSKDLQVPPEIDLQAIRQALLKGGNKQVTAIEIPNLNHLFQECKTGSPDEYAQIEQTFSPVALQAISDWVAKQIK